MRRPSLKAAEFQQALGTRPVARTAHFVLHHLPHSLAPLSSTPALEAFVDPKLSTDAQSEGVVCVDESPRDRPGAILSRLGLVFPKRLARRSVTRSLLRHQCRESLRRHAEAAACAGWGPNHPSDAWVLRLRAPFDRKQYPSAASGALNQVVRLELDTLWTALCARALHVPSRRSD